MDHLPPEIITNIVYYFYSEVSDGPDHPIAPLSVLCRHWQPVIEAETFRHLRLDPELMDYAVKSNILTGRLSYIRRLTYTFRCQDGSVPLRFGQWYNHLEFDLVVKTLFEHIARIPLGEEPSLDLEFFIPHMIDLPTYNACGFWSDPDVEIAPPDLPELPMVRSFNMKSMHRGKVYSPRAILYMASKMSRLLECSVVMSPPAIKVSSMHQRTELAQSLSELPMSIHNFSLRYHQDFNLLDGLLAMKDGEDILTRELRRFSQRPGLKDFTFHGCVEPSIFWPSNTPNSQHWPTLKAFVIHLDHVQHLAALHAGESIAKAKEAGSGDRIYVHKGIMNEFFHAAAKCSARMPNAEYNSLDFIDKWYTSLSFCTVFPEDPCLTINGKQGLEIDDEVMEEWRKTAEIHNLRFKVRFGGPES
ncbi:hypothetical protein FLONG3_1339 [Fusarium longipes]|uniref:F-box domain-containing protein n=1 Tax=Fusarium longipes TaxID=694270 RepID=A0A395T8G4_9HYPO|nr:hypothetical protein FLONG3_1339 [Fusarium longipes]